MDRTARQARFAPLGEIGQSRLGRASVVIVGCGAIGSVAAELLARAGVRRLRLVDRDVVERSNLHRLALVSESDAEQGLPKAVALARHLGEVRRGLVVEPLVTDVDGANVLDLLGDADLVLDGTDNFEARQLLNEACLALARPWVHAACLGATAVAWPIVPGGACFACLVPEAPAPGEVPTCETAGVLGVAVHAAASVQVAEALKLLSGNAAEILEGPWTADLWNGTSATVRAVRDPSCTACGEGVRRFLGRRRGGVTVPCGRSAVQVSPADGAGAPDLDRLAQRLDVSQQPRRNEFLLRFNAEGHDLTLFRDGRVLVSGTADPIRARALVARWLG